jgi:hypothetical protein
LEEAKQLPRGARIDVVDHKDELRQVKVNGTPKTWKTRPLNCDVPFKYGLYEYGYLYWRDSEQVLAFKIKAVVRV